MNMHAHKIHGHSSATFGAHRPPFAAAPAFPQPNFAAPSFAPPTFSQPNHFPQNHFPSTPFNNAFPPANAAFANDAANSSAASMDIHVGVKHGGFYHFHCESFNCDCPRYRPNSGTEFCAGCGHPPISHRCSVFPRLNPADQRKKPVLPQPPSMMQPTAIYQPAINAPHMQPQPQPYSGQVAGQVAYSGVSPMPGQMTAASQVPVDNSPVRFAAGAPNYALAYSAHIEASARSGQQLRGNPYPTVWSSLVSVSLPPSPATALATIAAIPAPVEPWKCNACTLVNDKAVHFCAACSTPRAGRNISSAASSTSSSTPSSADSAIPQSITSSSSSTLSPSFHSPRDVDDSLLCLDGEYSGKFFSSVNFDLDAGQSFTVKLSTMPKKKKSADNSNGVVLQSDYACQELKGSGEDSHGTFNIQGDYYAEAQVLQFLVEYSCEGGYTINCSGKGNRTKGFQGQWKKVEGHENGDWMMAVSEKAIPVPSKISPNTSISSNSSEGSISSPEQPKKTKKSPFLKLFSKTSKKSSEIANPAGISADENQNDWEIVKELR